jgi:hypothetical protein
MGVNRFKLQMVGGKDMVGNASRCLRVCCANSRGGRWATLRVACEFAVQTLGVDVGQRFALLASLLRKLSGWTLGNALRCLRVCCANSWGGRWATLCVACEFAAQTLGLEVGV